MSGFRCTFEDLNWRATFTPGGEDEVEYRPWCVDDITPLCDIVFQRLNAADAFWEDYDRRFIATCNRILDSAGLLRRDGHTSSSFFLQRVRAVEGMPRILILKTHGPAK